MTATELEDLLRSLAPQVLGAVVRRYGHFDLAEEATQEALLAASANWPRDGAPENPKGWLVAVAARRLTDLLRSDQARRRREDRVARWSLAAQGERSCGPSSADGLVSANSDDSLVVLFMCCHPSLPTASKIALTLRAVGGLSAAEIGRALLTSEQTVTRRITRAKQSIKDSAVPFAMPPGGDLAGRLAAVLRVLYLIFNEGYAATSGTQLVRVDLAEEAIRLTRALHAALPRDPEVSGLLALMLLVHARHFARVGPDGSLVPMNEQDRNLWDHALVEEGVALVTAAPAQGGAGPYQLQAAIAAVHDEAENAEATDWGRVVALYDALLALEDNPVVALNRAVAVSMVHGPEAGLALLAELETEPRVNNDRRFHAARAHLLELNGQPEAALSAYQAAVDRATSLQHQRYLNSQIARLRGLS
jgi:RNA polymerase sigma factor (sigma-70 family)